MLVPQPVARRAEDDGVFGFLQGAHGLLQGLVGLGGWTINLEFRDSGQHDAPPRKIDWEDIVNIRKNSENTR